MSNEVKGLFVSNPVSISKTLTFSCTDFIIYTRETGKNLLDFDIRSLFEIRRVICQLCDYVNNGNISIESFKYKVTARIDDLYIKSKNNINISENDIVQFNKMIIFIASAKECRHIVRDNLDKVLVIIKTISALSDNKDYSNIVYRVLYNYLFNKFSEDSEIPDEDLFVQLFEHYVNKENFDFLIFEAISILKNFDKCDLSIWDVINLCRTDDEYWLYTPFILRYKVILQDLLLKSVEDEIYDYWYSYVVSSDFKETYKNLTANELLKMIRESLNIFNDNDVFTYDSSQILWSLEKECNK